MVVQWPLRDEICQLLHPGITGSTVISNICFILYFWAVKISCNETMLGNFSFMLAVICGRYMCNSSSAVLQKTFGLTNSVLPMPPLCLFTVTEGCLCASVFISCLLNSLHIGLSAFQSWITHPPYFGILGRFGVILGAAVLACLCLHTIFVHKHLGLSSMIMHTSF